MDALLAKMATYLPGFFGALLAAFTGPQRARKERFFGFLIGFCVSLYLTEPVLDWFSLDPFKYSGGIGFVLGFCGMTLADRAIAMLTAIDVSALRWPGR